MLQKRIRIDYGPGCTGTICIGPESLQQFFKMARISKIKGLFEKGYMPNWSEDHFHNKSRIPKRMPIFKLADDLVDYIQGQFYEQELQPIEENRYLSETIIQKSKTQQGTQEFLVKWKGWPTKFNSWVKEED